MKNTLLTFVIGALIGAIITTLSFYAYIKSINSNKPQMQQMIMNDQNMENLPEKPEGFERQNMDFENLGPKQM